VSAAAAPGEVMKFGVIVFPGSNCDADALEAVRLLGAEARYIWHQERSLGDTDCVILPGGFSYGDYLRAGAIARFAPVMAAVERHAERGGLVLGICNGFQILLEAGMLPGAMRRNESLRFECRPTYLRVERTDLPFTSLCQPGQVIEVPVAHAEGNYFLGKDELQALEDAGQVVFRYVTPDGAVDPAANPNGAVNNIAGIVNAAGNVLGMMPHPERVVEPLLGGADGRLILGSIIAAWQGPGRGQAQQAQVRGGAPVG
jgi:phosphoribosylformylglycinamidine synthase subunit PurQ / glutaminase